MKFTLKDYQEEAVRDVLQNLRKARRRWHSDNEAQAFSLTAATGAGKTVMAAAVFEALFHGDDFYEFDADPGAVVIWFSDDPSLNEQTRFRLMECADRLRHTDLVVVENNFNRASFEAGKIYFLNTQKLGKKSLLVRGFDGEGEGNLFPETRPDMRSHTIWDTIKNSIEDPVLTLYLVLDEAHRGMGVANIAAQSEKTTLVRRLINGESGVPAMPIVLGVSATVDRFNRAMEGARDRTTLPSVQVDGTRVQESGLLKDAISLTIPDEAGQFDTVLLRFAAEKLEASNSAWETYCAQQGSGESVLPLMVLQVPNSPNHNEIGRALETIFQNSPDLREDSIAHVFGEHSTQVFGRYSVPYIAPERVQDDKRVRILIAKDAISTGWDCPRAEVMVSFRRAIDRTHITQLLGRMVRTPLARRIPGNERLNTVDCMLPFFDQDTVKTVVEALMQGGSESPPFSRVLVNAREMSVNSEVTAAVWDKFVTLPSQTRPQRGAKPPMRLTALAHELAQDELLENAGQRAHAAMHAWLDELISSRATEFAKARAAVTTVEGRTVLVDLLRNQADLQAFQAVADEAVIDDAYRRAARILSPDIARTYTEERARRNSSEEDDYEDALVEAREDVAALGLMENLALIYDAEATVISESWLTEYRQLIKQLTDDRQEVYRQITAFSKEPQDVGLARPESWMEATAIRDQMGVESKLSTYRNHLLCDEHGLYPVQLTEWEKSVLKSEMRRAGFLHWYRNPSRPTQDSLGIAFTQGGETKIMRPDFLFFALSEEDAIAVDIVDPHGYHLADALPKLQGLALYAEKYGMHFRRIEAVAEVASQLRALDMTDGTVRRAVMTAASARVLFEGLSARDYP